MTSPAAATATSASTPLARASALGAAGLGLLALAGCGATPAPGATEDIDTSASYTDGTYQADGSYISPGGQQTVAVELTLHDDIVTAVTVTPDDHDATSHSFQEKFAGGIAEAIVGEDIDTLNVSRVAGSSLTSGGFNDALATIKAEALAG